MSGRIEIPLTVAMQIRRRLTPAERKTACRLLIAIRTLSKLLSEDLNHDASLMIDAADAVEQLVSVARRARAIQPRRDK